MNNANFNEERTKPLIFSSPVTLDSEDASIKLSFYHSLKILKFTQHFRLVLDKIDPSKLTKIINKTYIVAISPYRFNSWTPDIGENKF